MLLTSAQLALDVNWASGISFKSTGLHSRTVVDFSANPSQVGIGSYCSCSPWRHRKCRERGSRCGAVGG